MKRTLTTILAVTMLFVFTASPALAHQRTASTSLSRGVSDTSPERGEKVTFSGRLQSNWDRCEEDQKVTLKRGHTAVETTRTDEAGFYSFTRRIKADSNWRIRFTGKRFGVHPHVHRCLPSTSRTVRIRVV
ncbi:MAG: hypothetical protein WEE66_09485 [Actinomycetota bacterium]